MSYHQISLDSRPEEVHRLLDWIEPILAGSRFGEIDAFSLRCAIVELVNNSIQHAYGGRAGFPVEVRIELTAEQSWAEIRDLGETFEGPQAGDSTDLLSESGRGFEIIRAWVDQLTFLQVGDWNVCRIEKHSSR